MAETNIFGHPFTQEQRTILERIARSAARLHPNQWQLIDQIKAVVGTALFVSFSSGAGINILYNYVSDRINQINPSELQLEPDAEGPQEVSIDNNGNIESPSQSKNLRTADISPDLKRKRIDSMPGDKKRFKEDDMDTEDKISTMAESGGTTGGSRVNQFQTQVTKVSNIPKTVYHPFPKTINVLMPYYIKSAEETMSATVANMFTFRLNSIYDCQTSTGYAADPAPSADTADGTVQTPSMRKYWMNYYEYWHVIKCDWSVSVLPTTKIPNGECAVYLYFHGLQFPPVSSGAALVPHYIRKHHHGVMYKTFYQLDAPGQGVERSQFQRDYGAHFKGTYYTGSMHNEVAEDEFTKTWILGDDVPPQRELLSVIVQTSENNRDTTVTDMKFVISVKLDYTVQLKDLRVAYLYPTQASDVAAITDYVPIV